MLVEIILVQLLLVVFPCISHVQIQLVVVHHMEDTLVQQQLDQPVHQLVHTEQLLCIEHVQMVTNIVTHYLIDVMVLQQQNIFIVVMFMLVLPMHLEIVIVEIHHVQKELLQLFVQHNHL